MFLDISDHLANFLILEPKQTRKERKNVQVFSDTNKSKFKKNLEAMSFVYQAITKAYNKSFPIVKLSRKRAKDEPWITSGLRKRKKKKKETYSIS